MLRLLGRTAKVLEEEAFVNRWLGRGVLQNGDCNAALTKNREVWSVVSIHIRHKQVAWFSAWTKKYVSSRQE